MRLNAPLEAAVNGVTKKTANQNSKLGPPSTPLISADLMFQRMEQQREIAQAMKKRALQMYENALVMAEKCWSRARLK